ncbi:MAG: hypothetical protein K8F54_01585 [Altibacter sp.]|uniref:hypothetical protein n=1 Tax=Altibacter sp. TaxID=2024823 RepID=UPI001DEC839A|nr:hypothetical protein [Altibacter sp.]MBZ0326271.1 hypothetical protein [Altibacter sp.]
MTLLKNIWEWDKRNFERLRRFQLPHRFKQIGFALFLVAFLALLAFRFVNNDATVIKTSLKYILLIGLLIISVSKEKIEDERIVQLRQQSYQVAFVVGVLYSILILPLVNYMADVIFKKESLGFEVNSWEVLFIMLLMQWFIFRMMRKKCS